MTLPFDPSPSTLWMVTRDRKRASCQVAFVPLGVEATILRNGRFHYARVFSHGDDALEWAREERTELLARGWRDLHRVRIGSSGKGRTCVKASWSPPH